ncbi:hypothetical protein [Litchfieldella xinjiangensis]|uniref:hypothetical protein n=1 Tax=Litchfieldella xinjiangensis TaxID=1166948 RepID=UPI0006936E76|nr:hypothetical protein [Halomonas xinjiangensis]
MKLLLAILLCPVPVMAQSDTSHIAICERPGTEGAWDASFFTSQGVPRWLEIDAVMTSNERESIARKACEGVELPVARERIAWVGPAGTILGETLPDAVTLQGDLERNPPTVSEVIWHGVDEDASAPDEWPRRPLAHLERVTFGGEERVSLGSETRFECRPGEATAGLLLRDERPWPSSRPQRLEVTASGAGRFEIAVSDRQGLAREAPVSLGTFEAGKLPQRFSFTLPSHATGLESGWVGVSLVCPPGRAHLELHDIVLSPEASTPRPRSAWVWSPQVWQDAAEDLWALVDRQRLDELFISVPVTLEGDVAERERLTQFITQATTRGVAVWPVIGDPRDVLSSSLPALINRLEAYRSYNASADEHARLAGVQLDIEPYLLPGFATAMAHWRERYIETIQTAHKVLDGQLALDLVMPVWWGDHADWGEALLDPLAMANLSITVMNYRTDPGQLYRGAVPFLEWGRDHGIPIRMALETGTLPDENRHTFKQADKGERAALWLVDDLETPLLVWLNSPERDLPGQPFTLIRREAFPASRLTFGGDQARLNEVADQLSEAWSVWPTFEGIALHGLDEHNLGVE